MPSRAQSEGGAAPAIRYNRSPSIFFFNSIKGAFFGRSFLPEKNRVEGKGVSTSIGARGFWAKFVIV